ncbi:DUF4214 domain-containing protein [Undibacterium amnicola]|uniref:DUF4214 domain-containing protein n=1 Tax=Undibacterium amnicola TaxID=1834038 RepID=A0ABR6XRS7_9BURK|nr:DUF4214 domain-containing protein [Undibacterium amnicola]MBC3832146.1 DUF4214 domain-containing protein [Undibacterium amnicola]
MKTVGTRYKLFLTTVVTALSLSLGGCGGGKSDSELAVYSAAPFSPAPVASDIQTFAGKRENYTIAKLSAGYLVNDMTKNSDVVVVKNKKQIRFDDVTVNLTLADLLNQVRAEDLRSVIELYIAFFNRVPEADGLAYWLGELRDGKTLEQIANSFYQAAIYYSLQTDYSANMSDHDFVKVIYKNVLGRSGNFAPSATEVNYWANELVRGVSKGSMIQSMLNSARTYANDPVWKFVPALLDGKLQVAMTFSVNHALSYLSPEQSILKTMAIAAAVTSVSTAEALKLVPVKDLTTNLVAPPNATNFAGICTPEMEKGWARGHLDDVYLWYRDIAEVTQNAPMTTSAYFDKLLVKEKDRFSFTSPQSVIDDFFQSGSSYSYGYSLLRQGSRLRVLFVEPGSPADLVGLKRGATISKIDNTSLDQSANDAQYAALYPSKVETHTFEIIDLDGRIRSTLMTSTLVVKSPVLESKILTDNGKKIGYMVFNDHIRTAEQPLINSIRTFRESGINEIVLDLRYNGGGYLYIADELAAMIGGYRTAGSIFETLIHNDKYPEKTQNSTSWFYSYDTNSRPLPWLNVPRVFILTGSRTCSASESIINGLTPFMEVILIGDKTCGKPYGFRQKNNCGTAYFAIEFSGVNALGQGDYVNGFTPQCNVADDLDHLLGDPNEKRLAAAISYVHTGKCPAATGMAKPFMPPTQIEERDPYPWRNIRLVQ